MISSRKIRRACLAALLSGSVTMATGCQSATGFSLSSMNPFSKSKSQAAHVEPDNELYASNGLSEKTIKGLSKQSDVDPLKLDNKKSVGPAVFVANGRLWESTGNAQKAMESYSQALRVAPGDPDALTAIARLHFREDNPVKAAEFFRQAIKAKPTDAGLHNDLGLAMNKVGNKPAAAMSLSRALELSPGVSRYANNLASIKFESGDADGAFKVLAGSNEPAVAHYNMAYLHQKQGNLDKARMHLAESVKYENAGKVDPSIARAVSRSKELLAKLGAPAQAPSTPVAKPKSPEPPLPTPATSPYTAVAQNVPALPKPKTPTFPGISTNIRQTSQSVNAAAKPNASLNVKPAIGQLPRVQNVQSSPARVTFPRASTSGSSTRSTPVNFATARLGVTTKPISTPTATTPTVAKPMAKHLPAVTPQFPTSEPSSPASTGPSVPFLLPNGFTMPGQQ